jgi:UDP-N-acetylglucosamine/UDP-N-acetylgalactosamine diphosphorylase
VANEAQLRKILQQHEQPQLLTFWDELDEKGRDRLASDIERIDFDAFRSMRSAQQGAASSADAFDVPESLPAIPTPGMETTYSEGRKLGEKLLSDSRVAAMTVAGGQATRLGLDAPKGTYPIGPVSKKSLFQIFAEGILATMRRYDCRVPWYVMTSEDNHDDTATFFEEHGYFGLAPTDVTFFSQGVAPVSDMEGRILLADKDRVAFSPNGHGGSLLALAECGMLDDMKRRGADFISYFQVDNPLVHPADPSFIGLHALRQSEASSLTIGKASDDEKVGLFVSVGGKLRVAEYSDFPEELARQRTTENRRKFDLANIAVHLFNRGFIERIVGDGKVSLPWHFAEKKAPHIDTATGESVNPTRPNAVKYEMFVFDALPLAKNPALLETTRRERFSPVKNAEGVDSVDTAKRDIVRRSAAWLESCGVGIPRKADGEPDCVVEISPLMATDVESLRKKAGELPPIPRGASMLYE